MLFSSPNIELNSDSTNIETNSLRWHGITWTKNCIAVDQTFIQINIIQQAIVYMYVKY